MLSNLALFIHNFDEISVPLQSNTNKVEIIFEKQPIHVQFYGKQGEPVVLLHGFLESAAVWKAFIPELSSTHQLVVPDLFGHGKTPRFGRVHHMEKMAEAIGKIMDIAGIASAKFIGHSMGGYVSLAFLERYPDRVSGILLLNSSPFADSAARLKERDQVIKIVQKHKEIMVKSGVNRLFSLGNRAVLKERIEMLIAQALKMETASIIATTKGMQQRPDRIHVLKNYRGDKWIFAGQDDGLIPCDALEKVALETGSCFYKFPGGHMTYIEDQAEVIRGVQCFLAGASFAHP